MYWIYKPSAGFAPQCMSVNFSIEAGNGSDLNFNDPNQLGVGGSGVVHAYGDAGAHHLTITGEADWTVTAVSAAARSSRPRQARHKLTPQAAAAQPVQPAPGTSATAVVDRF